MPRAVEAATSTAGEQTLGREETNSGRGADADWPLTLVVTGTVVADELDARGQSVNQLLVKETDRGDRVVVSVDTDNTVVLSTGLAGIEERRSVSDVEVLDVSACHCLLSPWNHLDSGNLAELGLLLLLGPDDTDAGSGCIQLASAGRGNKAAAHQQ